MKKRDNETEEKKSKGKVNDRGIAVADGEVQKSSLRRPLIAFQTPAESMDLAKAWRIIIALRW
jgi:hypothetical protein